jgi:hypothetical protein
VTRSTISPEDWQDRFSAWLAPGNPKTNANGGQEYKGFCPAHETPGSSTPSAEYNFERKVFKCFSPKCGYGDSLHRVWLMYDDIITAQGGGKVRSIGSAKSAQGRKTEGRQATEEDVKKYRRALDRNPAMKRRLREQRGLSEETIQEYELGWDSVRGRYTIPVWDSGDNLINIRMYKMGATEKGGKVISFATGTGSNALYGIDALVEPGEDVLLCEGEMDMLVARSNDFLSLAVTAGAGSWKPEWSKLFEGHRVFIMYDNDDAGRTGARKVAVSLHRVGVDVRVVKLDAKVAKDQDLTDFFVAQGFGRNDLLALMEATPPFEPAATSPQRVRAEPVEVSIDETTNPELANKPLRFVGTIAGKQSSPFMFGRRVVATCSQDWANPQCKECPMQDHGGQAGYDVPSDDKLLLRMVNKSEDQRHKDFLAAQRIPVNCPRVELSQDEAWSVEQLVVVPSIDDRDAPANIRREVYNVGPHATPVNSTVVFEGLNTDDPRTGVMVLQTWSCKETRTSLDTFEMTPEMMERLSVFQQREGETVSERLTAIVRDLAANVTHIYGRDLMHIAYDLVWHSLLGFNFRKGPIGKGWLELLVVGDTRTGKSEAAQRLTQHYQNGILTSCEGATLAGLVGGAQQVNNNWVITWGTIPLHDRRLVVLDEVSGLKDKGILEQMSEVRSSGRAKVTKIVSQETNARTRLIWISNPVDGRAIAEMPQKALNAITDLIPTPEDIARFDMAIVAAKADVPSNIINAARPDRVEHVYTSELCSQLVLWAWSRGPDAVVWERAAEYQILEWADTIGNEYVPDPPLLQAENARVKLARIAVAIAARLFSHDGTGEKVFVKKEHVYAARDFLRGIYEMPNMGYAQFSRKKLRDQEAAEAGKRWLWSYMRSDPRVFEVLKNVIMRKEFKARDFEEFGEMLPHDAKEVASDLLKKRMVTMHSRGYMRPTPQLVEVVTRMEDREYRRGR